MDTKHFAECIFYVQNGLKSYIFHSVLSELKIPGGNTPTKVHYCSKERALYFLRCLCEGHCCRSLPLDHQQWRRLSCRICSGKGETGAPSCSHYSVVWAGHCCVNKRSSRAGGEWVRHHCGLIAILQTARLSWDTYITKPDIISGNPPNLICTTQNPVDHSMQSVSTVELASTTWLTGLTFLSQSECQPVPTFRMDLLTLIQTLRCIPIPLLCSLFTSVASPPGSLWCEP